VSGADVFRRLERWTLVVLVVLAVAALVVRPRDPKLALGVVGGGALVGLSYWAIRGAVEGLVDRANSRESARKIRWFALVKFFTRHAILAVAGYIMMARLELHPLGMLLGVATPALAVAIEALSDRRRRPS
jgi:hypothetical protein